MKISMRTGSESWPDRKDPDLLAEWWDSTNRLPAVGDKVTFELVEWVVTDRVWHLAQGEEPSVSLWVKYADEARDGG